MKKWNKQLVKICFLLLSLQATAQTETFDIITYAAPKDWKKDAKPGVVNFTNVNTGTGGFCVLALFASKTSTGDAKKDFDREWNELAVKPYQAESSPKTETQNTAEGWTIVAGSAPVKVDGVDIYIMLTTLSGFGKTVTIRASLNDEAYLPPMTTFLESLELDKTKKPGLTNAVTTTAIAANATRFGQMLYQPPAGWSHQAYTDGVVFKPLDLATDEHLAIQIMQPLNGAGSLEQALQISFDEAATMYKGTKMNYAGTGKAYQQTEAKTSFQGWEYIKANGGIMIETGTGYPREFGLDLFIIKINNRFERVAVLKSRPVKRNCSMSSFYPDDRLQYSNDINNFLFTLQFADGPSPLLARAKSIEGGGIKGVWQGISMSVGTPTTSQPLGVGYRVFTPIFFSNGQAYFGPKFPLEGLDELDSRIPAEIHRRDWGFYTFSNGRGVLKMPYGDIPMRMQGNNLIITPNGTDHKFYQLPSVDGARFNGTYILSEAYGKIPSVSFTTAGRFTDNGAVRILYHEYNDCVNPALLPGSGTYEVKDYTITFNYSDGRKIKIAFLGTEYDIRNQSPAVLRMSTNEDPLTRQ